MAHLRLAKCASKMPLKVCNLIEYCAGREASKVWPRDRVEESRKRGRRAGRQTDGQVRERAGRRRVTWQLERRSNWQSLLARCCFFLPPMVSYGEREAKH